MDRDLGIYSALIHIVEKNLEKNQIELGFSPEAFLTSVETKPDIVNMSLWSELDNEVFLEVAYMQLLKRVPEKDVLVYWEKRRVSMTKAEYQKAVTESVINSEEFAIKKVVVSHNIYCDIKEKQRTVIINTNPEITYYVEKLVLVYRRLPLVLKKLAKKILK